MDIAGIIANLRLEVKLKLGRVDPLRPHPNRVKISFNFVRDCDTIWPEIIWNNIRSAVSSILISNCETTEFCLLEIKKAGLAICQHPEEDRFYAKHRVGTCERG
jgi:hypothetical protein